MDIGVGLPSVIRDVAGDAVLEWAKEADQAGFSSLATLDRLVYDNYDSLTTLAAAAAVTERAKLVTSILISPLHVEHRAVRQAGGDDRPAVERPPGAGRRRGFAPGRLPRPAGSRWAGGASGSRRRSRSAGRSGPASGAASPAASARAVPAAPPILMGGHSPAAINRAARLADGVDLRRRRGRHVQARRWRRSGRRGRRPGATGEPKIVSLTYYALGSRAEELADRYLSDYYGFAPPYAQLVLRNAAVGEEKLRSTLDSLAEIGCSEVILAPCAADAEQLKELREVVGK